MALAFHRAVNLIRRPTTLFAPGILRRVLAPGKAPTPDTPTPVPVP